MTWRTAAASLVLLGLVAAEPAGAEVTCKRIEGGLTLRVSLDQKLDIAEIRRDGSEIVVEDKDGDDPVSCAGGPAPTNTNTDQVKIRDKSGGKTSFFIRDPAAFSPGATEAGGDSGFLTLNEIEFDIDLRGGKSDALGLSGDAGTNRFRLGRVGINPNVEPALADADIFTHGVEHYLANMGDGDDELDASGSAETGQALRQPLVIAVGEDGDDVLTGGSGPDTFSGPLGEAGDDTIRGGGGNDQIEGDEGADFIAGGGGRDIAYYFRDEINEALSVDIGVGGTNDGGISDGPLGDRDEITASIENVTAYSDATILLYGTAGRNRLEMVGAGGALRLAFGFGGTDKLLGSDGNDQLTGGEGADVLVGRKGNDTLEAKDGVRDRRIDCGPGSLDGDEVDAKDPPAKNCEEHL